MRLYRFTFAVSMPQPQAVARLQALVGPPRSFLEEVKRSLTSQRKASPPFIGTIEADSFRIRRDIRYRNSFLPLIRGRVTSTPTGAQIHVTMSLHPAVVVFLLVWVGVLRIPLEAIVRAPSVQDGWAHFVPVGLLLMGLGLVCGGFFPEALKARRILEHAFAGATQ